MKRKRKRDQKQSMEMHGRAITSQMTEKERVRNEKKKTIETAIQWVTSLQITVNLLERLFMQIDRYDSQYCNK